MFYVIFIASFNYVYITVSHLLNEAVLSFDSSYLSWKPLKRKYNKILKIYRLKPSEVACVGDQLLTDIWGANRMDFLSILVNPIGKTDFVLTKFNRLVEPFIYKQLSKKELLRRGKYYE